jgi:signal transduction histidine kinase
MRMAARVSDTRLVVTGIAPAESYLELAASRARVAAAADESRRWIQRDLHDGAQQRLVNTILTLTQLKRLLDPAGGPEADLVDEALAHAGQAAVELRQLVHAVMPAALTFGGLRAAVHSLVDDMDLPVRVEVLPGRLPASVEMTAYFIVAEGLANTAKHSGAASARVSATRKWGMLEIEVSDDGVGGADPTRGTGLMGLIDRVAATGGRIVITSPPGEGTKLAVTLPAVV